MHGEYVDTGAAARFLGYFGVGSLALGGAGTLAATWMAGHRWYRMSNLVALKEDPGYMKRTRKQREQGQLVLAEMQQETKGNEEE